MRCASGNVRRANTARLRGEADIAQENAMKELVAGALALALLSPAIAADDALGISRAGTRAVTAAPSQHFTGEVRIEMLQTPTGAQRASAGTVSFSPGARTAWHSHPLGQTLIVTAGVGRVQRWEGPVEEIRAGDVVSIAPGVKHWHGAAPDSAMTHIALTEAREGNAVDWQEAVSDVQYRSRQASGGRSLRRSRREPKPYWATWRRSSRSSPTTCCSATCGRDRVVAARPQSRDRQCVDRAEPAGSAALAPGARSGQRAVEGRDLRSPDPPCVLRRLAQRHRRRRRGARSLHDSAVTYRPPEEHSMNLSAVNTSPMATRSWAPTGQWFRRWASVAWG